jgi:hypothetical protein
VVIEVDEVRAMPTAAQYRTAGSTAKGYMPR